MQEPELQDLDNSQFVKTHNTFERITLHTRLYCFSILGIILSLSALIYASKIWLDNLLFEELIIVIADFCAIITSLFGLCWSFGFSQNQNLQETILEENTSLGYLHTSIAQISFATLSASLYNFVYFHEFGDRKFFFAVHFILAIFLGIQVLLGGVLSQNTGGTKRLAIYITIVITLIVLSLAAIELKQVIQQIQIGLFDIQLEHFNLIQIELLLVCVIVVVLAVVNQRRVRALYLPFGFIFLVFATGSIFINGAFSRNSQLIFNSLNTKMGCRNALQLISQQSLHSFGCKQKYLHFEQSPFLQCPIEEQGVMWEKDEQNSITKLHTLACLNMDCCHNVYIKTSSDLRALVCLLNVLSALLIVSASNAIILSKRSFLVTQLRISGDMVIIALVILMTVGVGYLAFSFAPTIKWHIQDRLVPQIETNKIVVLPLPNYSKFALQNSLNRQQDLSNCQLVQQQLLVDIDTTLIDNNDGIRVAISAGEGGNFLIKNNFNSKNFWVTDDLESLKTVFGNLKPKYQYIIFEGKSEDVDIFMQSALYYCSNDPLNVDFIVAQQQIVTHQPNIHGRNLQLQPILFQDQSPPSQMNQLISKQKLYDVEIIVQLLTTGEIIPNAVVNLYIGDATASVDRTIQSPPFQIHKTNQKGQVLIKFLNMGIQYTTIVKVEGLKMGVVLIDLTPKKPRLTYTVNISPQFSDHSMRIILESRDSVQYNLFGTFQAHNIECMTSLLTKPCGGMEFNRRNQKLTKTQYITVNKIFPYKYLFFVNRFLSETEAQAKLHNTNVDVNEDITLNPPSVTVYVSELNYPIFQLSLPIFPRNEFNQISFNWLVMCLNGQVGDQPQVIQRLWHDIVNEDVLESKAYTKKTWPSSSQCN